VDGLLLDPDHPRADSDPEAKASVQRDFAESLCVVHTEPDPSFQHLSLSLSLSLALSLSATHSPSPNQLFVFGAVAGSK
jgi:hypothetical protein